MGRQQELVEGLFDDPGRARAYTRRSAARNRHMGRRAVQLFLDYGIEVATGAAGRLAHGYSPELKGAVKLLAGEVHHGC